MESFNQIAKAMASQAKREIAIVRAIDAARPVGQKAIDIDHYDRARAKKQYHSFQGDKIKWSAVLVKWDGKEWKRIRRLTGPSEFSDALSDVTRIARQRDLQRVG